MKRETALKGKQFMDQGADLGRHPLAFAFRSILEENEELLEKVQKLYRKNKYLSFLLSIKNLLTKAR